MVRVNEPSGQASALYDSEATEDECDAQDSLASQASEPHQPPLKRKRVSRGRRALQQLLKDPHASPTRPLARHDAAFKAAIQRGCAAGVERPRRRSVPTPRFSIPHAKTPTLHLERDAAIFRLVLERRPFLIHRNTREKELLGMVVRALKPNAQREMLVELEEMAGTPAAAKRLRQQRPNEVEEVKPEEIPYVALAAEDEGSTDEREVKRSRRESPHAPVHRNESLPMTLHEPPSTDSGARGQQLSSSGVDVPPDGNHAHRIKHSMEPILNTRTCDSAVQEATVISPKLEEVQTKSTDGFGESYTERVTLQRRVEWLEAIVHTLQTRVQNTEALSAAWAQRLADERQRHHARVEMLMDLLKSEREAQRQETRAMLDTVTAERRERHERPFVQLPPLLRYHNGGSSVVESGAMQQGGSSQESPFSTRLPRPW